MQVMEETANEILRQIPRLVDMETVSAKFPVLYEQSMNTVLAQEIIRYATSVARYQTRYGIRYDTIRYEMRDARYEMLV